MAASTRRASRTHVVAHLSDTHLLAPGQLLHGRVDTGAQLRQALSRVEQSAEPIDALVVSGDLTDTADPRAYALFREIVDPVVERLGAVLVTTGGNHDERRPLAAALHGLDTDAPQDRVHDVRGLRVVTLDSAMPGYHHGGLDDAQYAWLATVLAEPAEHGTLLAVHHAPIAYRSPTMTLLDFDDVDRLGAALAGTDVRAVLSGHLHVTSFGTLAGIPVLVAGGVSYADDIAVPPELMMGVDGPQSWNLVEVYPDDVVSTVAPVTDHPTWPVLTDAVREYLAAVPEDERREVFSRKRTG
jgi:Icc protein